MELGIVIRDPWYDYGTDPLAPDGPNRRFQDRMGAALADLGARWVRLEFHIEGEDVVGQIARNDYFINEVAPRHGIQILGLLSFGLLRAEDPRRIAEGPFVTHPLYGGGVNAYIAAWLDRARMVAARYGPRVAAYEILNEHNRLIPGEDALAAHLAARLHTKFYRLFHTVDRAAPGQEWRDATPIIIGGLHAAGTGAPNTPGYLSDAEYLAAIYTSEPFQGYRRAFGHYPAEGVGHHPYPEEIRVSMGRRQSLRDTPEADARLVMEHLSRLRAALAHVGAAGTPFWITEVGVNAGWARKTEAGQAAVLRLLAPLLRDRGDVAHTFWFKYEDFPPAEGRDAQKWGVVRIPFAPGPCPGGACYEPSGEPALLRESYRVFQALAG